MAKQPTVVMGESPEQRAVAIELLIDEDSPATNRCILLKIDGGASSVAVKVRVSELTTALLCQLESGIPFWTSGWNRRLGGGGGRIVN